MMDFHKGRKPDSRVPCYGCRDRTAECHPKCERFRAYRDEIKRLREAATVTNQGQPNRSAALDKMHWDKWRKLTK